MNQWNGLRLDIHIHILRMFNSKHDLTFQSSEVIGIVTEAFLKCKKTWNLGSSRYVTSKNKQDEYDSVR